MFGDTIPQLLSSLCPISIQESIITGSGQSLSSTYRDVKKRLVNLVKQDPGRVRQNS